MLDVSAGKAECIWDERFCVTVEGASSRDKLAVSANTGAVGEGPVLAGVPAFVRQGVPIILNHGRVCWIYPGYAGDGRRLKFSAQFVGKSGLFWRETCY